MLSLGEVHEHAMLTYLVSGKRDLGNASLTCEGGCACAPLEVAAKTHHPITVRYQQRIVLSEAHDCDLRVRVTGGYFQARAPEVSALLCSTAAYRAFSLFLCTLSAFSVCLGPIFLPARFRLLTLSTARPLTSYR